MEEKILSMYAKGMTTGDIESHMRELYDIDISDSTISRITDKILPIVKEWQERPLEEVYAVVFMDAIHYHVRSEGRIVKRAVYIALGIDMSGKKDVLGMYVGENESAKFWLSIMNGLKNRGVEDIREFDTLKCKKVPQILEIGFFLSKFYFYYIVIFGDMWYNSDRGDYCAYNNIKIKKF